MSDNNDEKCPFCGSGEKILRVRHDSDWCGAIMFHDKEHEPVDREINTDYCDECESFGDFDKIFKLIK